MFSLVVATNIVFFQYSHGLLAIKTNSFRRDLCNKMILLPYVFKMPLVCLSPPLLLHLESIRSDCEGSWEFVTLLLLYF